VLKRPGSPGGPAGQERQTSADSTACHPPANQRRRRPPGERGQRLDAEAVLTLGELAFLAQVTIAQQIE
jgi:hypothetical protein